MCFIPTFFGSKATVTEKDLELAKGISYNRYYLQKLTLDKRTPAVSWFVKNHKSHLKSSCSVLLSLLILERN